MKRAIVSFVCAALMLPTPAGAHVQTRTDGRNPNTPLDLTQVSLDHDYGRLTVYIHTRAGFTNRALHRHGFIGFYLWKGKRSKHGNYAVIIYTPRRRLVAHVGWAARNGNTDWIGWGTVHRAEVDELVVKFHRDVVDAEGPGWIKWRARSAWSEDGVFCEEGSHCVNDFMPDDQNAYRHHFPN